MAEAPPDELGGRDDRTTRISFRLPDGAGDLPASVRDAARVDGQVVSLRVQDPVPPLRELTAWATERGVGLPGLEVRRASLEDVYLELTGAEDAS